jgi:hypothetical protein
MITYEIELSPEQYRQACRWASFYGHSVTKLLQIYVDNGLRADVQNDADVDHSYDPTAHYNQSMADAAGIDY